MARTLWGNIIHQSITSIVDVISMDYWVLKTVVTRFKSPKTFQSSIQIIDAFVTFQKQRKMFWIFFKIISSVFYDVKKVLNNFFNHFGNAWNFLDNDVDLVAFSDFYLNLLREFLILVRQRNQIWISSPYMTYFHFIRVLVRVYENAVCKCSKVLLMQ